MPKIFVASGANIAVNPVTRDVRLDFEDKDLDEITIELPLSNLQHLVRAAEDKIGPSQRQPSSDDPVPLGSKYRVTAYATAKTAEGVCVTIHLQSETGTRFVKLNLSPKEASELADDLYQKIAP